MNEQPITFSYTCPTCGKELQVTAGATSIFCVGCKNWADVVKDTPDNMDKQ